MRDHVMSHNVTSRSSLVSTQAPTDKTVLRFNWSICLMGFHALLMASGLARTRCIVIQKPFSGVTTIVHVYM